MLLKIFFAEYTCTKLSEIDHLLVAASQFYHLPMFTYLDQPSNHRLTLQSLLIKTCVEF